MNFEFCKVACNSNRLDIVYLHSYKKDTEAVFHVGLQFPLKAMPLTYSDKAPEIFSVRARIYLAFPSWLEWIPLQ